MRKKSKRLCRQGCVDVDGNPVPFKGEGCKHRKLVGPKTAAEPSNGVTSSNAPSFYPDATGSGLPHGLPRFSELSTPDRYSVPAPSLGDTSQTADLIDFGSFSFDHFSPPSFDIDDLPDLHVLDEAALSFLELQLQLPHSPVESAHAPPTSSFTSPFPIPLAVGEASMGAEPSSAPTQHLADSSETVCKISLQKRKQDKGADNSDIDTSTDEEDSGYIEDDYIRSKCHSERCGRIKKSLRKLDDRCRPYIFFYVSRPESILLRNGRAHIYMSRAMQDVLQDSKEFGNRLHSSAEAHARRLVSDRAKVIALNKDVQALLEKKRKLEHQTAVLSQQPQNLSHAQYTISNDT
ncbi:hypothetical protein DXG01_002294 [Tephrocybe rancida]|nr:hypothetical protein DXG01_002294 [Tephrocybe rancida]